jgi:hypothetical protein
MIPMIMVAVLLLVVILEAEVAMAEVRVVIGKTKDIAGIRVNVASK